MKELMDKLGEIFANAILFGHPGGVITATKEGSFFLPEPDDRSSVRVMRSVNELLQGENLKDIARAAFTMADGNANALEGAFFCETTLTDVGGIRGSMVDLRWHDYSCNNDWSALKYKPYPLPLID